VALAGAEVVSAAAPVMAVLAAKSAAMAVLNLGIEFPPKGSVAPVLNIFRNCVENIADGSYCAIRCISYFLAECQVNGLRGVLLDSDALIALIKHL
jgi:hypothetical protein